MQDEKFLAGFLFISVIVVRYVQSFYRTSFAHSKGGSLSITMNNARADQTKFNQFPFLHILEYPDDDYSHLLGYNSPNHKPSRLQVISQLKIEEVIRYKKPIDTQGCGIDRSFYVSSDDLREEIVDFDEKYSPPLNLFDQLVQKAPQMAIAAEFKRASPSKGDINPTLKILDQCLLYAEMGATVISVLTEFKHFKGTLDDMKSVRIATESKYRTSRPAILRKDFVFDRYQILEARAYGADTVLLIVAVLGVNQLQDLISFSRQQGMEPLVEVHTDREMEIAISAGARVVGVNNRDLHSFQLDLGTTERLLKVAERRGRSWHCKDGNTPDLVVAALSGITTAEDVQVFRELGVQCCLIGETLMKAADPRATLRQLFPLECGSSSTDDANPTAIAAAAEVNQKKAVLVKTCGMRSVSDVSAALQAGTHLIGVIFASKSPRAASVEQAQQVVQEVRRYGERAGPVPELGQGGGERGLAALQRDSSAVKEPRLWFQRTSELLQRVTTRQPLVVGVFQNQSIEEVNEIIRLTGVDLAQLHGNEDVAFLDQVSVPCIKVVHISAGSGTTGENVAMDEVLRDIDNFKGKAVALLFDSKLPGSSSSGGAGQTFDWSLVGRLGDVPVLLAGGLTAENVGEAVSLSGVVGVDVSSGVELSPGEKDLSKMRAFINNAKQ